MIRRGLREVESAGSRSGSWKKKRSRPEKRYGESILVLLTIPIVLVTAIARARKKPRIETPSSSDDSTSDDVVSASEYSFENKKDKLDFVRAPRCSSGSTLDVEVKRVSFAGC